MMPRIDIDEDVFRYLQSRAIAYVEKPNDTLRRLFQLEASTKELGTTSRTPSAVTPEARPVGRKRPKANLGALVAAGVVGLGQKLYLHDYQRERVPGAEAL